MEVKIPEYVLIHYTSKPFQKFLDIKDIDGIILESICVYGLEAGNIIARELSFGIDKNDKGGIVICPYGSFSNFMIQAKRVVRCNVMTVKAGEYLDAFKTEDGDYVFTIRA